MSMSIYYQARRSNPLNDGERARVNAVIKQFAVEDQIEVRERTGIGSNWDSFCVYNPANPTSPDVVFEGATKLPDNSEEAFLHGLQNRCTALSLIRRNLDGANWQVHVDDHDIDWDASERQFNSLMYGLTNRCSG